MHQNSFLLFFFFSFFLNFLIAPPLLPLALPSLPAAPLCCWPSRRTGFSWRLTDLTSSSIVSTSASLAVSNPKLAKPSGFSSFRLPKRVRTGKKENLGCRWNLKHHQQFIKEVETGVLEVFIIWRDCPWTGKEASSAHKTNSGPQVWFKPVNDVVRRQAETKLASFLATCTKAKAQCCCGINYRK